MPLHENPMNFFGPAEAKVTIRSRDVVDVIRLLRSAHHDHEASRLEYKLKSDMVEEFEKVYRRYYHVSDELVQEAFEVAIGISDMDDE